MSLFSSGRGWTTFNMANSRSLMFTLCLALAAFSLAAHFIADAACWSPEVSVASPCDSGRRSNSASGGQLVVNGLHTGVVTPAIVSIATPIALCLALARVSYNKLSRLVSPPVQPPKIASIA